MVIGVLDLQGAVDEHIQMLAQCGVTGKKVLSEEDLNQVDGLIIPGGESTAIMNLLLKFDLLKPLQEKVAAGLPIFGTCAGLVLLSRSDALAGIEGEVERNGFGRQKDSFQADIDVAGFDQPFPGIFIRAPYLKQVADDVEVLAKIDDDRIIAVKHGKILATSFHPELSDDTRMHQLFLEMVSA
ncbi:pyridoxal 5'-phosphate synthase glutaminase subunit PdxT [Fructobacillus tropaeoli]|uniref:Pyridoxal 5'-phosphate synthase subunit PdxT n=1 Tax=Fructobacillus tropaeoli TaxID=709323 RepID=A0A3F3GWZ2_9LACO|nr:pyridoxal 5'-phosphate synthase glutaminase subunit PdxT [Fructobacillus tropaeoli]GAP03741.1 glutamine amidotransferase subunit PdxT [Fructobacillus tropaeoli]CAK1229272.1 Pyridoxal 5'-phosphate synthase subunit PdxT (glutamine amidotransferase) (PdxT) [Fructobacillus tropaeoli]CAK1230578.1 Pyridoxal 5'-phosphate synthase subunit PdxT (glutamine amidotransferase) (PdxT) [Fructobacillus tropaeoli]